MDEERAFSENIPLKILILNPLKHYRRRCRRRRCRRRNITLSANKPSGRQK